MPNWSNPRHRNDIIRLIETEYVPISPNTHKPEVGSGEPLTLQPFQVEILNCVFTPRFYPEERDPTTGKEGRWRLPYRTIVYSCPKKSGKTAIAGAVGYAWSRIYGGEMLSIANDERQAMGRAFDRVLLYVEWLQRVNPEKYQEIVEKKDFRSITTIDPYSLFRAIPCDPSGEAGGFQSLTIWDELWAYNNSEVTWKLWTELQPIPNLPESIRFVVTYAGYYGESELLYSLYEQALQPDQQTGEYMGKKVEGLEHLPCYEYGDLFVYWDHVARMPWHTEEFLESAKNDPANKGRPHEYLRLWENRWTTGNETFLDINKFDQMASKGKEMGLYNRMDAI